MAYEKKEWHTGDIIDADGLNNIEEGISALDEVVGSSSIDVVESDVAQLKDDMQTLKAHFPATGKFVSGTGSATANYAHAEGDGASASGSASHAEGSATEARGDYSHTEGYSTIADGESAHAEGDSTGAKGDASHASGEGTVANRKAQTVFGRYNVGEQTSAALAKQYGDYVEIVGNGTDVGTRSNARTLDWSGNEELAGDLTINKGKTGEKKISTAIDSLNAHFPATGKFITGELTSASGNDAVAVGRNTAATGHYSNAEGSGTTASGVASHAEGSATTANGDASHAEGTGTTATSAHSHAEGNGTQATGLSSHSEGSKTVASGSYSHAEGYNTIAKNSMQHVGGAYNIEDPSSVSSSEKGRYVEIIGNGTIAARSNARTLDWSGNEYLAGSLKLDTITLNPHYDRSEEKTLSLVNCKKLRLYWSVEDGGEATEYEVEVTAENITALLALLTTFGGISSPLSDTESTQTRTLISRYSGITNPLTASEITQLRALISGGGSGGGEEEPPAVVVDPDEPGTEDPYEEPPA